jgi:DNA-binding transcriptional MocR family regulator
MRSSGGLKPQDVLVLLKLATSGDRSWRLVDLAQELGLSLSEVSMSLERSKKSGFLDSSKKKLIRPALAEFILHGLKYAYPAAPGRVCRGMPTAHSALPLSKEIVSNKDDQYVWPWGHGNVRGQAIEPLYESAPEAASKDPKLHQLLALVDALRVGRARERQLAGEELKRRLHA